MLVIGYDARGERETAVNGEHVLLIGPPGSGKTQGFLVPSIVTHPGPVLATSSKGDIALTTVARRRRVGRTLSFSPGAETVPGTTPVFWDPVRGCDNYDEALLRADARHSTAQEPTTPSGTPWPRACWPHSSMRPPSSDWAEAVGTGSWRCLAGSPQGIWTTRSPFWRQLTRDRPS
ncbi:MAG: type IV secretory system conjugative DNA transfer family protein [Tetrasphaera sp.]|nr:type IV secretory system conjugative DNA transfer family protein [Tetrasphaera sp.]